MKPNNVSIGFSDRKLHNLKNRLLPILILASYIVPFIALLWVDLIQKYTILVVPIALTIVAVDMLGATLWIWYKYIRFFGFPSLQACRKMLQLDAIKVSLKNPKEAKGEITNMVIAVLVLAVFFVLLWRWTGFTIFLFPAVYSLSIAVKGPIRRARPPAVLLLGGSSYDGTRLQLQLVSIFGASLVMSGLFHKEDATVRVTGMLSDFNSIRTADYGRWQEMIVAVLQLSRIVIIDIRKITEAVQFEITQATKMLDPKRVFFIGQGIESVPPDRCFGEAELLNVLRMKYSPQKVQLPRTPSTAVYEDKKNGYFRFIPPAGWICSRQSDPRTKVKFSHPVNPGVYVSFIVREDTYADFASLVRYAKKTMQEIEAGFGATCQMEITKFTERETIEITITAKNSEVILIRLFRTNGLHFTITYGAPNKMNFSTHLGEVNRSLETIEPLHGITDDYEKKLESMSQQEIARGLRLAELSADVLDINKANRIIADLLRKYPNNKDVLKMADDLEKLSKNKK
jgi:hypothetical protein